MPTTFSTFDTTAVGLVAAIKAAILASTDWSNPAGQRVQCTTTRGVDMVVDLADASATGRALQFGVYRTAALADKIVRYMQWRSAVGVTTDPLHVTVSAGKEHLFIIIEGPRAGELGAEISTSGSYRPVFFLCDLVPYFPTTDTVPAVVCGGTVVATVPNGSDSYMVHVSRNAANNSSWAQGGLETLGPTKGFLGSGTSRYSGQPLSSGGPIVRPYVVFEDMAGLRGRLGQFFCLGWNIIVSGLADFPSQPFSQVVIDSKTYLGLLTNRQPTASGVSPFAYAYAGTSDGLTGSPIVAVPYS